MRRRDRLFLLGAVLVVLAATKLGQQVYRWQTYEPERAEIGRLEGELENAALGLVRTQIEADSLKAALESLDHELRDARGDLDLLERTAMDPRVQGSVSGYYRSLEAYNRRVRGRNAAFGQWRETLEANREFVDRYNSVADSIRALAEQMGELYYPIRSPAEIAVLRGWGEPGG